MFLYFLMVLTTVGMFYAHHQQKSKGVIWGRSLAGFLGIVTVLLAGLKISQTINQPKAMRKMIVKKEQEYVYATMEYLGNYLAKNYTDHRILLISNSSISEKTINHNELMIKSLEKGLNGKLTILANESVSYSPQDDDISFSSSAFDSMVAAHPECNFVISLAGLPRDYEAMKLWLIDDPKKRPKLFLVFCDVYGLKDAINTGYITGTITYNRKYKHEIESEIPKNIEDAFHKRFILIDKNNWKKIDSENPGLFKK